MKNTKWMKEMTSAELAEAIKNGHHPRRCL